MRMRASQSKAGGKVVTNWVEVKGRQLSGFSLMRNSPSWRMRAVRMGARWRGAARSR